MRICKGSSKVCFVFEFDVNTFLQEKEGLFGGEGVRQMFYTEDTSRSPELGEVKSRVARIFSSLLPSVLMPCCLDALTLDVSWGSVSSQEGSAGTGQRAWEQLAWQKWEDGHCQAHVCLSQMLIFSQCLGGQKSMASSVASSRTFRLNLLIVPWSLLLQYFPPRVRKEASDGLPVFRPSAGIWAIASGALPRFQGEERLEEIAEASEASFIMVPWAHEDHQSQGDHM